MKFRVLTQHTEEAAKCVATRLKSEKIKVYDIRETDIVDSKTKDVRSQCYVLLCKGSKKRFETIKDKWYTTELKYENVRTLL